MGKYLNQDLNGKPLQSKNKARDLIASGATKTDATFKEDLVCVVENGPIFDAAAYCYSEREFQNFNDPSDPRPKTWLIVPRVKDLVD